MIERQKTGPRMSRIVKHRGTVYLCGQVGSGAGVLMSTLYWLSEDQMARRRPK
ncbi:hypothetical protein ACEWPM_006055 [Roseovarius sp. S4756]|uniref:hypothetical protein n=1 Tax=Roseovarius maritimus TaxID=3342637 RepID=UPI00372B2929